MASSTLSFPGFLRYLRPVLFGVGLLALAGTWFVFYLSESLFSESHLAAYYCCLTPDEVSRLPAWERTLSEFFDSRLGEGLVAGLVIGLNGLVFVRTLRRAPPSNRVWLPLLFVLFNVLFFVADTMAMRLSWAISDRVVGPQLSAYKGYHRTWYGVVCHLALWAGYYRLSLNASRVSSPHTRPDGSTG